MMYNRFTSLVLALLAAGASASSLRSSDPHKEVKQELTNLVLFKTWASEHGKKYESQDHAAERMKVWMDNHARIEEHNNQQPAPTYLLGHNEYSDMTQDEFARHFKLGKYSGAGAAKKAAEKRLGEKKESVSASTARKLESVGLPDYVNWVMMGGVTPVKNQGACGSCWAFSTTGALEGAKFVRTGELAVLSEQNLLDCDHTDLGCNGGLMDNAFKFDEKSGGLCSEEDYPYEAKQNKVCRTDCTDVPGTIVRTFYDVPPSDEKALLSAIAMQPISVAIQADQFVFQFYKSGVLTDSKCGAHGEIDHGVLAVGYGTDLETQAPYFLVKNSWGASWGENGYIRLGRESKNEWGICAIMKMASYPEVE